MTQAANEQDEAAMTQLREVLLAELLLPRDIERTDKQHRNAVDLTRKKLALQQYFRSRFLGREGQFRTVWQELCERIRREDL